MKTNNSTWKLIISNIKSAAKKVKKLGAPVVYIKSLLKVDLEERGEENK